MVHATTNICIIYPPEETLRFLSEKPFLLAYGWLEILHCFLLIKYKCNNNRTWSLMSNYSLCKPLDNSFPPPLNVFFKKNYALLQIFSLAIFFGFQQPDSECCKINFWAFWKIVWKELKEYNFWNLTADGSINKNVCVVFEEEIYSLLYYIFWILAN